jgi:hypothetical protein
MLTSIYKRKGRPGFTLEWHKPGMIRPKQKTFRTKAAAIAYRDELRGAAASDLRRLASSDPSASVRVSAARVLGQIAPAPVYNPKSR